MMSTSRLCSPNLEYQRLARYRHFLMMESPDRALFSNSTKLSAVCKKIPANAVSVIIVRFLEVSLLHLGLLAPRQVVRSQNPTRANTRKRRHRMNAMFRSLAANHIRSKRPAEPARRRTD